uniref:Putative secreted peptide n=1 Tax=Anopheles braziliensis TaxID=58242 RepID=A0A2M3ZQP3_9DIPT
MWSILSSSTRSMGRSGPLFAFLLMKSIRSVRCLIPLLQWARRRQRSIFSSCSAIICLHLGDDRCGFGCVKVFER